MFDLINKHKRLIQILIVLLVVPFAFFGLEAYTRSGGGLDAVATVEGVNITQRDFSEALNEQQDRMRATFGGRIDPEMFDTNEARTALVEALVSQRLIATEAVRSRLLVSDEALRGVIGALPAFQRDGVFSKQDYETIVRAQGLTEQQFETRLRYDLTLQQLGRAITDTAIASRTVAERIAMLEGERREVAVARIEPQAFMTQVKVTPEEVRKHYEANQAAYRAPERVKVEYLVLSGEALAQATKIDEDAIKAAYQARSAEFKVGEQRRASHILITVAPDASKEDRAKAQKKAESLLVEVQKTPGAFAELAKKHSQDTGSAEKGGDLGFFGRGMMVKPFEEAVFGLKEGETSGIVESEFGYHIIRLTGVQSEKARPLDEVRKEIVAGLRNAAATRRFAEAAEGFSNMVYEQTDALKPAAEKYGLELKTSDWIARGAAGGDPVLGHPKVTAALFSEDALKLKRNTDAIEVAPNTLVAARVLEYQAARQRGFDEVQKEIEQSLRLSAAAKLAREDGAARLERLKKGETADLKWSAPQLVSRQDPKGLDEEALRKVVTADTATLPAYIGLARGEEGYALYRVSRIEPAPVAGDAKQKQAALERAQHRAGAAHYAAYVESLRKRADVTIKRENFEKKP